MARSMLLCDKHLPIEGLRYAQAMIRQGVSPPLPEDIIENYRRQIRAMHEKGQQSIRLGRQSPSLLISLVVIAVIGWLVWSIVSPTTSHQRINPAPSHTPIRLSELEKIAASTPTPEEVRKAQPVLVAKTFPKNGTSYVAKGLKPVAPLSIRSEKGGYYVLKLKSATTNKDAQIVFIHGGSPVEVSVPLGNYTMVYASGSTWYGADHRFGPQTLYSKADTVFEFKATSNGYSGYTVTLYKVENGNLATREISEDQF